MAANPVTQYAEAVTAGLIVAGPSVRAACRRHLEDLKTGKERGWRFDLAKAMRAINFFPDVLKIEVDGKVDRFELLLWQKFVVGSLFGWVSIKTGFRRFDRAYIESGKGSGKTPLMAGIGLYMMLADGELSAEVYAAAAKREQAMRMFTDVVDMVDRSVRLSSMLEQTGKKPVWKLRHRESKSVFQPVSSDKAKSGARVSCGLVDELHEHRDRYTIDMLEAGFKNRKQPLMMVATNAGHDRESICYEWHDHAVAVVEGLRIDEALFAFVLDLDPDDDPLEDEACWPKTNPGIDITVTRDYLRKQVNAAREIPGRENGVRRLNFCQWTDAETTWITRSAWMGCEERMGDVDKGKVVVPELAGANAIWASTCRSPSISPPWPSPFPSRSSMTPARCASTTPARSWCGCCVGSSISRRRKPRPSARKKIGCPMSPGSATAWCTACPTRSCASNIWPAESLRSPACSTCAGRPSIDIATKSCSSRWWKTASPVTGSSTRRGSGARAASRSMAARCWGPTASRSITRSGCPTAS
jgi:hypothetical protein